MGQALTSGAGEGRAGLLLATAGAALMAGSLEFAETQASSAEVTVQLAQQHLAELATYRAAIEGSE